VGIVSFMVLESQNLNFAVPSTTILSARQEALERERSASSPQEPKPTAPAQQPSPSTQAPTGSGAQEDSAEEPGRPCTPTERSVDDNRTERSFVGQILPFGYNASLSLTRVPQTSFVTGSFNSKYLKVPALTGTCEQNQCHLQGTPSGQPYELFEISGQVNGGVFTATYRLRNGHAFGSAL